MSPETEAFLNNDNDMCICLPTSSQVHAMAHDRPDEVFCSGVKDCPLGHRDPPVTTRTKSQRLRELGISVSI